MNPINWIKSLFTNLTTSYSYDSDGKPIVEEPPRARLEYFSTSIITEDDDAA